MILAVVSGKGGVGKSTVAFNVAAALNAVVVDADLGMADLPASRGPDLHDVLAGRSDPIEAVREQATVSILPCGRSLAGASAADPMAIVETLEAVEEEYDSVVVDCPAGMAADVGLPLYAAGRCLLVTTPDEVAVPDAIRTRALARVLDAGIERVVLNKCGGSPPIDGVRRALGAPVTPIPEDERVRQAQSVGQPVVELAPHSESARQFQKLGEAIR